MALSAEQRRVAAEALGEARRERATPREQLALLLAGLTESNLQHDRYRNVGSGDRDSVGFLQQRPSQGWGAPGESVAQDTRQFLAAARRVNRRGFNGSAGQLAQAVQRSAFPDRYDQRRGEAQSILRQFGGGGAGAGSPRPASPADGGSPLAGVAQAPEQSNGQQLAAVMLSLQAAQAQQPRPSVGLAPPAISAAAVMPQGAQSVVSSGGPRTESPGAALAQALTAIKGLRGPDVQEATLADGGSSAPAQRGATRFSGDFPLGRRGKVIGTPHAGTHTLGNWQSDNAIDISVPVGTPMVAVDDGVVVKVRHHPQDGGRFAGDQITIRGKNGNSYFYAHGRSSVKAGQKVKRGQSIGRSGAANGVPHLHIGVERGDPRKLFG